MDMEQYKQIVKKNVENLINNSDLKNAKKIIEEYEKLVPYDEDVYSIKGVIAMMEGNMDEAEEILKNGIVRYKNNFDILYNLAYLYEMKEKYISAYRYYKKIYKNSHNEYNEEISKKIKDLENREEIIKYNERKKVLMIAYAFPPIGGPGVQRTLKFVKYLRNFGWEPIVLTVGKTLWITKDESLLKEIPEELEIIRIDDVNIKEVDDNFIKKLLNMYYELINNKELFQKYISVLSDKENKGNYLFIPEYQSAWAIKAIENIENYVDMKEIDMIYTSADPNVDNFIGYYLKKQFSKPWVADFRDAWTKNPYANYDKMDIKYSIECAMEENILPYADSIVTVTPLISADFASRLNLYDKVETITNGYDESDFNHIDIKHNDISKFTIMHNGLFYQKRTPLTFLQALKNILEKNLIDRSKIKVYFTRKDIYVEVVKKMNLEDVVEFTGYMTHGDSLKKASNCDLLLLVLGKEEENKSIYTGKIFEYLRLNKAILALSPKDSLVDNLICETNRGKNIEFDDIEGIENYILEIYKKWEEDELPNFILNEDIKKYERKKLTEKLSEIFVKVLDRSIKDKYKFIDLKEKDQQFYNEVYNYGGWNETYFKHYSETLYFPVWSKALELIKQINSPNIIDIGCGPGQFAKLLFDNNLFKYKGIDFSDMAIKYAKIRNDKYRNSFCVDDAYASNIFNGDYNIVTMFEVLEHIDDDLKIMSKIKGNSNILFSVPNFYTDGHIRWFNSEQDILERYEDYVIFDEIFSFLIGNNNVIYLVKGKIKK